MSTHRIEIGSDGLAHSLRIDGHDISKGATGLTLTIGRAGELPELQVDLRPIDVSTAGAIEARVFLTPSAHDALVAIGWTPPAAEGSPRS
ncbi:hypothetical protein ACFWEH_12945 [Streptomyces anulatus]|uniref:hypothetical protein n=1 Tax=Streptomyces TaxID=1883 RepID=UPI00093B3B6D|nr:hypothetical protein [Streptomyces sp. TSRI0395]OKI83775.1 hypothetical protein AMK12_11675 [Streptomyces sp. TSRI0395]